MTNLPIVVIKSEQQNLTAEDIITNIRKIPIETGKEILDVETETYGYKYHLTTKYYDTDILLCPLQTSLDKCPQIILNYMEGFCVYFDAANRNFLKSIPNYAQFLESNEIELGILLCDELYDDTNVGITYKEARKKHNTTILDVIELERKHDDDEEEDDIHDPIGYDELIQAFKSFLWSNVEMVEASRILTGYVNFGADDIDLLGDDDNDIDNLVLCNESVNIPNNENTKDELTTSDDGEKIEAELRGFEKLLNDVIQFRNCTSTSRNERLLYAQNFAEVFDELIGEPIKEPTIISDTEK